MERDKTHECHMPLLDLELPGRTREDRRQHRGTLSVG